MWLNLLQTLKKQRNSQNGRRNTNISNTVEEGALATNHSDPKLTSSIVITTTPPTPLRASEDAPPPAIPHFLTVEPRGGDAGGGRASSRLDLIYSTSGIYDSLSQVEIPQGGSNPALDNVRKETAARHAKVKSWILACFLVFDLPYCLFRAIFVIGVSVDFIATHFVPESLEWIQEIYDNCRLSKESLQSQETWIGFATWLLYLFGDIVLILAVCRTSICLCYLHLGFKVLSILLNFLGLVIYVVECSSKLLLFECVIFFAVHIPLQILDVKSCGAFIRSVRKAKGAHLEVVGRGGGEGNSLPVIKKSSSPVSKKTIKTSPTPSKDRSKQYAAVD